MKFLADGKINSNRLLQITLFFTLLYVLLLWITNILIFTEKMGFNYESVSEYYVGSEENFRNPFSYTGLLEMTHIHLFLFAMALLLVNHLTIFSRLPQFAKLLLILISFTAGLSDIGSGWFIRYISPSFAYLKIASFVIFQISFFFLILSSFFAFNIYQNHKRE